MKFKNKTSGIVTFFITPNNEADDIDFILYKANEISSLCETKSDIRCMASGESIGSTNDQSNCMGVTGLDTRSLDKIEMNGCKFSDDNFLKFLDAENDETYVLFINNYDSDKGFSILFDGTADFEVLEECLDDKNKLLIQLLNIFPNPSQDLINLSIISKNEELVSVSLLNLEGKKVKSFNYNIFKGKQTISLDISYLPSGNYFLKIDNDKVHLVDKFTKE
jgi:hypothetical protein